MNEGEEDKELDLSGTGVEILQNQTPACAKAPAEPYLPSAPPLFLKLNPGRGMAASSSEQCSSKSWVGGISDNHIMSVTIWKLGRRKSKSQVERRQIRSIKIWHIAEYLLMKKEFLLTFFIVFLHNTFFKKITKHLCKSMNSIFKKNRLVLLRKETCGADSLKPCNSSVLRLFTFVCLLF